MEITRERRARKVVELLEKEYPSARTALDFKSPLDLLVATMLSAQSTDKTVNTVTKVLFKKYHMAQDYAKADVSEIDEDIKSVNFRHTKARNIKKMAQILVEKFQGQVPKTMDEMLELPGVARKTANVVLSNAYHIVEGIAVDTHVLRVSRRLGLTDNDDPVKVERDLMQLLAKKDWRRISHQLICHGRAVCVAKNPRHDGCVLNKICPTSPHFGIDKSK